MLCVLLFALCGWAKAFANPTLRTTNIGITLQLNSFRFFYLTPTLALSFKLAVLLCHRTTFLIAEACLIAGAKTNAYHTKYRGMIYADNFSCESLRKGVFIAGAVFVIATMILNVYYYMYFTKATTTQASHKTNRSSSNIGMAGYA